jgi:hypothetical protein
MKALVFVVLLAALTGCMTAPGGDQEPMDRPYAAGAPSGGVPLWNPGETFVGVAGGACRGTCPIYELYVFDDGRVVFMGKKDTGKTGVFNKRVDPSVYAELLTTIVRTKVLEKGLKRGTCLADHPMLMVMRSVSDGQSVRTRSLNSGCEGHADLVAQIERAFIDFTATGAWIASGK